MISLGAVFIAIEAVLNIGLLMGGLEGGGLEAFLQAVLISLINVGGLGIAAGYFLFTLRRRFAAVTPSLYQAAWGGWMALVLGFNFVAGRYRQLSAAKTEAVEADSTLLNAASEISISSISFNPFAWGVEALLVTLLGIVLCALGCAKGFTFARKMAGDSGIDAPQRRDHQYREKNVFSAVDGGGGTKASRPLHRQLFDAFVSLPQSYQGKLTQALREQVADWYRTLDQERRNVTTLVDTLKQKENTQASIDIVEQAFIAAYNGSSPEKVDLQRVEAHRQDKHSDLLLSVKVVEPEALNEAAKLVDEWGKSGQAEFDKRIAAAHDKISRLWKNYQPLVLGDPTQELGSVNVAPTATPRSR